MKGIHEFMILATYRVCQGLARALPIVMVITTTAAVADPKSVSGQDLPFNPEHHDPQGTPVLMRTSAAWDDYQIIMWQRKTPQQYAALKGIGITAVAVFGQQETASTLSALR